MPRHRKVDPRAGARRWIWLPVLLCAALGIALLDRESGLASWWRLRADLRHSAETAHRLEIETGELQRTARALRDEEAALERAIREDLGLARRGEVVVIFESDDAPSTRLP